jgi:SAM-dependent methyltransferase
MPDSDSRTYWEERFDRGVSLGTVGWLGLGQSFNAWMYRVRARRFLQCVRPYVRPSMRVLDVGVGTGFYVDLWQRLGVHDISGCDITEAAVAAVRERFPNVHAFRADIAQDGLEMEPERFDAISAMDVLFHIVEDDAWNAAIRNVARLLRSGGTFVWSDNFLHSATLRGARQVSRSLDEVEAALTRYRLRPIVRRPVFALMNTPVDTRSPFYHGMWRVTRGLARRGERLGNVAGMALYPCELLLTSLLREGPSTELMICRKE